MADGGRPQNAIPGSANPLLAGGSSTNLAASFVHATADDDVWPEAWPGATSWPGAEDTLSSIGSLDASAILVDSSAASDDAGLTTSGLVISRLVAEKERLQKRVEVLTALAYNSAAEEELRRSTNGLPAHASAEQIQAMWRRAAALRRFRSARAASLMVQAAFRGRSVRVAVRQQLRRLLRRQRGRLRLLERQRHARCLRRVDGGGLAPDARAEPGPSE